MADLCLTQMIFGYSALFGAGFSLSLMAEQSQALFSLVKIAFLGSSLGLIGWALWVTSWIFDYGSLRLVESNGTILLLEALALTVLLASGSILTVLEARAIGTKRRSA